MKKSLKERLEEKKEEKNNSSIFVTDEWVKLLEKMDDRFLKASTQNVGNMWQGLIGYQPKGLRVCIYHDMGDDNVFDSASEARAFAKIYIIRGRYQGLKIFMDDSESCLVSRIYLSIKQ